MADDGEVAPWLVPAILGGVGVLLGGIGGFLTVRSFRAAGRRTRILREGMPTQGRVIAVLKKISVKVNGRHPFYLTYEFTDNNGQHREGESPLLPRALESRWDADDTILVLYDPDDPSQHEVEAVVAAMTLPYSQGQTEGRVNKLKFIKRSMYGRGKFDLLRQRVIYASAA